MKDRGSGFLFQNKNRSSPNIEAEMYTQATKQHYKPFLEAYLRLEMLTHDKACCKKLSSNSTFSFVTLYLKMKTIKLLND